MAQETQQAVGERNQQAAAERKVTSGGIRYGVNRLTLIIQENFPGIIESDIRIAGPDAHLWLKAMEYAIRQMAEEAKNQMEERNKQPST